jgi:uncharacterized protein YutE (UPF0331/DUF86 family)
VVDKTILARKLVAIRDAVDRIDDVLPDDAAAFVSDRTCREVVTLNLFLALQESIAIATHWIADAGWDVPASHGAAFTTLAERGVIDADLAERLRAAAGLRNLIAHQYGVLDFHRLFGVAQNDTDDLLAFCAQIAAATEKPELEF